MAGNEHRLVAHGPQALGDAVDELLVVAAGKVRAANAAGYGPQAAVSLWRKMGEATGNGGIGFLSTHPTGPDRIQELEQNVPRVQGLYLQSRR